MEKIIYNLYDVVEMRKAHPCKARSSEFQIIRMGADIKIRCLACRNVLMFTREDFDKKIKRVIRNEISEI